MDSITGAAGMGGGAVIGLRPAPLRPLGTAEILDGAVRLVRRNIRATLAVAVPFAVVRAVLGAWLSYLTVLSQDAAALDGLAAMMLDLLFGTLLAGLLCPLYSSDLLGNRLSAGESLRRVGRLAWPLVGLTLVVTLAEGAGLVALVVGGVWLWGIWAVAAPALVLEGRGVGGALRRSFELVRGRFWRTWGIRALGFLLRSVLALFVTLPFELLALATSGNDAFGQSPTITHPALYVTILAVGGIVSGALLLPLAAAIDVLLYTDLRMRKEGMDIILGLPAAPEPLGSGRPAATAW